jgi:hypothetical protein
MTKVWKIASNDGTGLSQSLNRVDVFEAMMIFYGSFVLLNG